jgi:catechol 2,3-dioxygenase-like lactoylglutathione lyase family enzyme
MPVTGAFFALSVADLQASSRWYEEHLGLTKVMEQPRQGTAAVAVLEGGGLIAKLIQDDNAVPLDFDRALALLRERRVKIAFDPYPARPGQRANVIIEDNAGNLIQLFGPDTSPPRGHSANGAFIRTSTADADL